jgi:hypothetical protein
VYVRELAMNDFPVATTRARTGRPANRNAADYIYQAATVAAALLLLLTATI